MNDPRQCERCGDTISNGQEAGPVGDYLFLCQGCEAKLKRQARPRPFLKTYQANYFVEELLAQRSSRKGKQ